MEKTMILFLDEMLRNDNILYCGVVGTLTTVNKLTPDSKNLWNIKSADCGKQITIGSFKNILGMIYNKDEIIEIAKQKYLESLNNSKSCTVLNGLILKGNPNKWLIEPTLKK